jgi:hypothetical protein
MASHSARRRKSKACEWPAPPVAGPRLLLLALDNVRVPSLKPYTTTNVNLEGAESIANLILAEAGVNPWIVDTRFAIDRLNALKRDRVDWLFDLELQLADGVKSGHAGDGDEWQVGPFAQICQSRTLEWVSSGAKKLPRNIVVLCGPRGSGKGVLLLRAIASAGTLPALPQESWLVDFAHNKQTYTPTTFRASAANELGTFLGHTFKRARKKRRHIFLAIDGLDGAARHVSTASGGSIAPELTHDALKSIFAKLRDIAQAGDSRAKFTVVVSLNAIDFSKKDQREWQPVYDALMSSGALFATLRQLPIVDDVSYSELYAHHLGLKKKSRDTVARYINSERQFLRLPLFLDAASSLSAERLEGCSSRADFLRSARGQRSVPWPNELDELAKDLDDFISTPSLNFLANEKSRSLLTREWTGAWLELLTESMRLSGVRGLLSDLMKDLLNDARWRWDLSATFALSNVVTALSEAGHAPKFETSLRFCNLRRATMDSVIFGPTSTFLGVDCTGASLRYATFDAGCRFIATDFTECVWDKQPSNGGPPVFVDCLGL